MEHLSPTFNRLMHNLPPFLKKIIPGKYSHILVLLVFIIHSAYTQNCPAPIPLNITNISTESASVSWFQSGSPDSFDISLRTVPGSYPTDPQFTGIPSSPYEISGLESGVLYEFRIRSRCGNQISSWSQPRRFITHLTNPSNCQLSLPLGDNNCGGIGDIFRIEVSGLSGDSLGKNVFVDKVNLIIEHTWPADLNIRLRSPSGQEMTLSSDNGIGGNHYGNPMDSLCFSTTSLSDAECTSISEASPPFIGSFKPEDPFSLLYDGTNPNGIWELLICDKAPGDIGTLLFFEIVFAYENCLAPEVVQTEIIGNNQLQIILNQDFFCDTIILELGPEGFSPEGLSGPLSEDAELIYFSCTSDTLFLSGLEPNSNYDFYLYSVCDSLISKPSCVESFSTNCPTPNLSSNFDAEVICNATCLDACNLTGWWKNLNSFGPQWQVNTGPTPTDGTGPENAEKGFGNYLYFDASSPLCYYPENATLESACLLILSNGDDCELSFSYHMWGPEVRSLTLLLSTDGGFHWDTLWHLSGNQGNEWHRADVDLSAYHGLVGRFRFVAAGSENGRGDIALDNILIYHANPADSSSLIYFVDADADGYGQDGTGNFFCTMTAPEGWADKDGDCDDENPDINPGAEVIPCNLIDENCTGLEDDQPADNPITHELLSFSHESCSQAGDGSIEINISGGNPPYSILWNTGDSTLLIQSLSAGVYFATIADSDSCLYRTEFFEIQTTTAADLSFVNIDRPSCSSFNDGKIEILVGGGSPPFSFKWNSGDTTDVITNLFPGNYRVTVTDADSCVYISDSFQLRPLDPFEIIIAEKIIPVCYGNDDGSISVQITGGMPPFKFQWSTGDSLPSLHNLNSGIYGLTVTDANNCQVQKDSILLDQPEQLIAFYPTISPPLCPGQSTARVMTEIQGGTFPYTFLWQKGNKTYTTKDLLNIPAGNYMLTVTDFNGCHFFDEITITQPDSFRVEILDKSDVSCGNRTDGSISVDVSGGWPPYEVFWSNGTNQELQLTNLSSGYYQFTISDQSACKYISEEFFIQNRNLPLQIHLSIIDSISCFQAGDGVIRGEVISNYPPFIFDWSHLNPLISDSAHILLENLQANNYLLTATDATACRGTSMPLLLNEPADLIITDVVGLKPSCFGDEDGKLIPVFTGGTPPYAFLWSNGSENDTATHLTAGSYHLTITDKNNCSRSRNNIVLIEPEPLLLSYETKGSRDEKNEGEVQLIISGGIPPYDVEWDEQITRFSNETATELNPGTYQLLIRDANGCVLDTVFVIDLITGIISLEEKNWILYPNPAESDLYLKSEHELTIEHYEFSIRDLSAKQIEQLVIRTLNHHQIKIQLPAHLPSGAYFLEITNKTNGDQVVFPFLIHRK